MFNVLLVDDEMLIRTEIKLMFNWEENGYYLCGEASSGKEALEVIYRNHPQIVISDVRMPDMDGLELAHRISMEQMNIKVILLSNYDDFEYVRSALKYGVSDYILKHSLSSSTLLESLSRASAAIKKEPASTDTLRKTMNNIQALKEKFVQQLISGFFRSSDEISQHLRILDLEMDIHFILPVAMAIDNYTSTLGKKSIKDRSLLEYAIINITNEITNQQATGLVANMSEGLFAIILSFKYITSQAHTEMNIYSILDSVSSCINKFLEISVSFSFGEICSNISKIPKNFEQSKEHLNSRFYLGKNCVIRNSQQVIPSPGITGLSLETEKEIISHLKLGNLNVLESIIENLFKGMKDKKLSVSGVHMISNDLLGILIRNCKEKGVNLQGMFPGDLTIYEILMTIETIDEIKDWFLVLFKKVVEIAKKEEIFSSSEYVKKAITYIKAHYTENIFLPDVADSLGIAKTYLSSLFKSETGIGFVDYLNNLRMSKAKVLMEEERYEIKEIINMCGFNNYEYFFKLFKKKFGRTPKEYISDNAKSRFG